MTTSLCFFRGDGFDFVDVVMSRTNIVIVCVCVRRFDFDFRDEKRNAKFERSSTRTKYGMNNNF